MTLIPVWSYLPLSNSKPAHLRTQDGFSLVQVLLAVTLLSLALAVIAHWTGSISLASASLNQSQEVEVMMENVAGAFLDDDTHCRGLLAGTKLSMANTAGKQLAAINYKKDSGSTVLKWMQRGQPIAGTNLTLQDLRIVPLSQVDPRSIVAQIEYTFSKNEKFGAGTVRRFTPVYATVTGGVITDCTTAPIPREVIKQRQCEILSDATQSYDRATNTCVDNPNVVRISSVSGVATCGAGEKPAANPLDPRSGIIACRPPSFTLVYPRSYTDGFVNNGDMVSAGFTFTYATSSCAFTGLKNAAMAGAAQIRCVPGTP
jgi:hypothetical protein